MAWKELLRFDDESYKKKIHQFGKDGTYHELARREVFKRRRIHSLDAKIFCCTLLLLPTGGSTGMGLILGYRQRNIARKKYQAVVDTMKAHGMTLPTPKKKDKFIPIVINIIVYSLTLGLMYGLEEVGIISADEISAYGFQGSADIVDPSLATEAHQFVTDPGHFTQGVLHGAHFQASELHGLVSSNETMAGHAISHNVEQPISDMTTQYISGETAGAQLAPQVEQFIAVNVVSQGLERLAKRGVNAASHQKPGATDLIPRKPVAAASVPRKPVATQSIPRKPVPTGPAVVSH